MRLIQWRLDRREPDHAAALLKRLVRYHGSDVRTLQLTADIAEQRGDHDAALDALRKLSPAGTPTLRMARLYAAAGRDAEAADVYHRLCAAAPHDPQLLVEAAQIDQRLGDEARLESHLAAARRLDSTNPRLITLAAQQQMRLGRFAIAGRLWWQLRFDTDHAADAWAHLAVCAACESREALMDRAMKQLDTVVTDHRQRSAAIAAAWRDATPGQTMRHFATDAATESAGDLLTCLVAEAQDVFEQELDEHDSYADLHYHLSVCHAVRDQPTAQAECLDRALDLNAGYQDAARDRVTLLLGESRFAAAQAVVAGLQRKRGNGLMTTTLAVATLAAQSQVDQAHQLLNDAPLEQPQRRQVHDRAESILRDAGLDAAADHWRARLTEPARPTHLKDAA